MPRRNRRGSSLLEVVIALAVLGVAGIALLRLIDQAAHAVVQAERADDAVARASSFLDAVTLWSRGDLDRHLGVRVQGSWRMQLLRDGDLYRVAILDSASRRAIVVTTLYRRGRQGALHAE